MVRTVDCGSTDVGSIPTAHPNKKEVAIMGEMRILDESGDTKKIWDPDNEDEVKDAKRSFEDLIKKGFRAFLVDKKGEKGGAMQEFDPNAGKMILIPRMQGG